MIIMGIDIGWINLALVIVKFENSTLLVQSCRLINLNNVMHNKVSIQDCTLHHSNEMYDKVQHVVQEYKHEWEHVDEIVIERQPIRGLKCLEQFFFGYFRHKCILINPIQMHKCFWPLQKFNYDQRKQEMVKLTELYLQDHIDWQQNIRQHDLADALGLIFYYLSKYYQWNGFRSKNLSLVNDVNICINWDKFKYDGPRYNSDDKFKCHINHMGDMIDVYTIVCDIPEPELEPELFTIRKQDFLNR